MSGLLLDTHAMIWLLEDNPRLGIAARTAIMHPDTAAHVSVASPWELQIKMHARGGAVRSDLLEHLDELGISVLPISLDHGLAAGSLPLHHRDPFDRMLIAQCVVEDLTLVTVDRVMRNYDIRVFPAAA
jgi:PIN domain nuclease of toxin-antitoxin system